MHSKFIHQSADWVNAKKIPPMAVFFYAIYISTFALLSMHRYRFHLTDALLQ